MSEERAKLPKWNKRKVAGWLAGELAFSWRFRDAPESVRATMRVVDWNPPRHEELVGHAKRELDWLPLDADFLSAAASAAIDASRGALARPRRIVGLLCGRRAPCESV